MLMNDEIGIFLKLFFLTFSSLVSKKPELLGKVNKTESFEAENSE